MALVCLQSEEVKGKSSLVGVRWLCRPCGAGPLSSALGRVRKSQDLRVHTEQVTVNTKYRRLETS